MLWDVHPENSQHSMLFAPGPEPAVTTGLLFMQSQTASTATHGQGQAHPEHVWPCPTGPHQGPFIFVGGGGALRGSSRMPAATEG